MSLAVAITTPGTCRFTAVLMFDWDRNPSACGKMRRRTRYRRLEPVAQDTTALGVKNCLLDEVHRECSLSNRLVCQSNGVQPSCQAAICVLHLLLAYAELNLATPKITAL